MDEKQARERIKELKGYYSHLASYVAVIGFLFGLNLVTSGLSPPWFLFPAMGWGIGLFIHTAQVFWTGHQWEARKMEELTGLKSARDDIHTLSERTDALVTILSGVNWEKIDPSLLDTRDSLAKTRDRIARLERGENGDNRAEIRREIEKLEEFVTSSRFEYYDRAAGDPPRSN